MSTLACPASHRFLGLELMCQSRQLIALGLGQTMFGLAVPFGIQSTRDVSGPRLKGPGARWILC